MMKILVIPSTEFTTTYSGTRYLLSELVRHGFGIHVFLRIPPEKRCLYEHFPYRFTFFTWWSPTWPKALRILSILTYRVKVFVKCLRARVVLTTESMYLPEIAAAKRFNKTLRVINFCQELFLLSELPHSAAAKFCAKFSYIADLTIDVEPNRARLRQMAVGLKECPLVLLNTVPETYVLNDASLSDLAGVVLPHDRPIVLYAGGISTEKPFSRIVNAVAAQGGKCFLLAFCATIDSLLEDAKHQAEQKLPKGSFCIHAGVPHKKILAAMHEANIGIVDYPYTVEKTSNVLFCAPTKLYEYLAAGLAVVGSANESLKSIIEENDAGACAETDADEDLGIALTKVLSRHPQMQRNARTAFVTKYTYEKCCSPVVDQIANRIQSWAAG